MAKKYVEFIEAVAIVVGVYKYISSNDNDKEEEPIEDILPDDDLEPDVNLPGQEHEMLELYINTGEYSINNFIIYEKGMTWVEWFSSDYYDDKIKIGTAYYEEAYLTYNDIDLYCGDSQHSELYLVSINDEISYNYYCSFEPDDDTGSDVNPDEVEIRTLVIEVDNGSTLSIQFEKGMTWREFEASDYNTIGLYYYDDEYLLLNIDGMNYDIYCRMSDYGNIWPDDFIVDVFEYYASEH